MAKNGWFEHLVSLTRRTSSDHEVEGLVLSGGGSRASFQIGALRYLYEHCHIKPTRILGTSAGSAITVMLSQSLDAAEQEEQLRVMERYWMAMTDSSEIFTEQSWFTTLKNQWGEIEGIFPEHTDEVTVIQADEDDPEVIVKDALEFDPLPPNEFSASMLWRMLGAVPKLGRTRTALMTAIRGADRAASAYRPGPILYRLLFESGFSKEKVKDSGVEMRIAFVGLNSGELRFMRQDGVIVDTNDHPVSDESYDLSLGVWASCAIPGVFRPVQLGDDVYVDGGVRENAPVEMAISHLGVTRPYVVTSTPPGLPRGDYASKDMVSVMTRSLDIVLDEVAKDEVDWARTAGAIVIEPRIEVHNTMTVEHGLLALNRDYGWMRAAEEMNENLAGLADPIITVRLELYHLVKAKDVDQLRVRLTRERLRSLLASTDPELLPEGWQSWPDETWEE